MRKARTEWRTATVLAGLILAVGSLTASAQTFRFWDVDPATGGCQNGSGTWTTSGGTNWADSVGAGGTAWVPWDYAGFNFTGALGSGDWTITLDGTIEASDVQICGVATTNAWTFTGGTLKLGNRVGVNTLSVGSLDNLTVNSPVIFTKDTYLSNAGTGPMVFNGGVTGSGTATYIDGISPVIFASNAGALGTLQLGTTGGAGAGLTVSNGQTEVANLYVGYYVGNKTMTVSNPTARMTVTGNAAVGTYTSGALVVSNGGTFEKTGAGAIYVGLGSGSTGSITVTGTGSSLSSGYLFDGYNAGNNCSMTVADNATVNVGAYFWVADGTSTNDTLNLGDVGGAAKAATINVTNGSANAVFQVNAGGTFTMGAGSTLNVDQFNVMSGGTFAKGSGAGAFESGTINARFTNFSAANVFTIGDGAGAAAVLNLVSGGHTFAHGIHLLSDGKLTGSGAIVGNVESQGLIAPTNLALTGDLLMDSGSELDVGIAGSSSVNTIAVSGTLTATGTLKVAALPGFDNTLVGQSFRVLNFGALSGTFNSVTLPTLASGLMWNTAALYTTGTISTTAAPTAPEFQFWDADPATGGCQNGSGTWTTAPGNRNWADSDGAGGKGWIPGNYAGFNFTGALGSGDWTITLEGTIEASDVQVCGVATTNGWTFTGGTLKLGNRAGINTLSVGSLDNLTVNSPVIFTADTYLTNYGTGPLVFNGSVTGSGTSTYINGSNPFVFANGASNLGTTQIGYNGVSGGGVTITNGSVTTGLLFLSPVSGVTKTVTVTNPTASLNSSILGVGTSGNGILAVSNGGTVTFTNGYLGFNAGSTGSITVTGAGSSVQGQNLLTGYTGATNTLMTVADGGAATMSTELVVSSPETTGNVLNLGDVGGAARAGTITVTNDLHNALFRVESGGTLTMGAGSTLTADVFEVKSGGTFATGSRAGVFESGSINTKSTSFGGTNVFTVGDGAGAKAVVNLLGGVHTFANGVHLLSDGQLNAAANSPTAVTVSGDLTMDSGSELDLGIGASVASTMTVTGTLAAGGTLNVAALPGFNNTLTGQSFTLFSAGAVRGTFGTVTLPVLVYGLKWDTSALYTTGKIGTIYDPAIVLPPTFTHGSIPRASLTIDGDLSDWPAGSAWSTPFVLWYGKGLNSTTRARFAWNYIGNVLYVAVQTNEASVQPGGHLVVGLTKNPDSVPTESADSTQLCFDYDTTKPGSVWIRNESALYGGTGVTTGVVAAATANAGTYTYELAIPFWDDWTNPTTRQMLAAGDPVYVYVVMQDAFETPNGTDLSFYGNPYFYSGAWDKAAALTLVISTAANVTGTLNLQSYSPGPDGVPVTVQLKQSGAVVRTDTVTLDASGQFTLAGVSPGTYDVRVKASHWLAATRAGVVVGGSSVDAGTFDLANGDADGDNQVSFADFALLQNHYSQSVSVGTNGDFNGDGMVTFEDFSILQNNYGESGTAASAPAASLATADNVPIAAPCSLLGLVLLAMFGVGLLFLRSQE